MAIIINVKENPVIGPAIHFQDSREAQRFCAEVVEEHFLETGDTIIFESAEIRRGDESLETFIPEEKMMKWVLDQAREYWYVTKAEAILFRKEGYENAVKFLSSGLDR